MTGITLDAAQIRSAPPQVRAWLQEQVATLFADMPRPAPRPDPQTLATCTVAEARAILAQIQDMLPVVSVFFELGRDAPLVAGQPVRAFRVIDIQHHAHLRAPEQVGECLTLITDALREVRGDARAMICAFDQEGHCFVADATSRAVLTLWQEIVAARGLAPRSDSRAEPPPTVA